LSDDVDQVLIDGSERDVERAGGRGRRTHQASRLPACPCFRRREKSDGGSRRRIPATAIGRRTFARTTIFLSACRTHLLRSWRIESSRKRRTARYSCARRDLGACSDGRCSPRALTRQVSRWPNLSGGRRRTPPF
jgi:hypothetical protein